MSVETILRKKEADLKRSGDGITPLVRAMGKAAKRLVLVGTGILGLTLLGVASSYTPSVEPQKDQSKYELSVPSFAQGLSGTQLLEIPNGPVNLHRQAIRTTPLIRTVSSKYLDFMDENAAQQREIPLGESLKVALDISGREISQIDSRNIDPNLNLTRMKVHLASFAMASGFSTRLGVEDLVLLGRSQEKLNTYTLAYEYFWADNGPGKAYPRLFSIPGLNEMENDPHNGKDKMRHLAYTYLFSTLYLESADYRLGIDGTIPLGLQAIINSSSSKPEERVRVMAAIVGQSYELMTTMTPEAWPTITGKKREQLTVGKFDLGSDGDLAANMLGVDIAIILRQFSLTGRSFNPLIDRLNDPGFRTFGQQPSLQDLYTPAKG